MKGFWPEGVHQSLWKKGLVPEASRDLGVPSCVLLGAAEAGKAITKHHRITSTIFRTSFVVFSIFDLPPNRISRFAEYLKHLQLSLTSTG